MVNTRLSALIALHGGGLSGIDSYAEQIAAAAAESGYAVTLLALGESTAIELRRRFDGTSVSILPTAEVSAAPWPRLARRLPQAALAEMRALMIAALAKDGARFDVAHLNHPGLAAAARRFSSRVVAGSWFYPHTPVGRVMETWRHTGRLLPRSAALAVKGFSHYLNDRAGYRSCDLVAAPTDRLAAQLHSMGIPAAVFPPPAALANPSHDADSVTASDAWTLMICAADLAHPRKNVLAGIRAAGILAKMGHRLELVLVGGNAGRLAPVIASLPPPVTVRMTGRVPRPEIQRWMAAADALVVPSLYEEWGYVATEALMAGTPVAAFPVYPFDDVLGPPFGRCADEMTPGALARAIAAVIEGHGDRQVLRQAAAARYGPDAAAERLRALWSLGPAESPPAAITAHEALAS